VTARAIYAKVIKRPLFHSGHVLQTVRSWSQFVCQGNNFNGCFRIQQFDSEKADICFLWQTVKNRPKTEVQLIMGKLIIYIEN